MKIKTAKREELIDEFLRDLRIFDFKDVSITTPDETKTLEIKVLDAKGKLVLKIDLEDIKPVPRGTTSSDLSKYVHIYGLGDASTYDLDQYAWLFDRISELIHNLERVASNDD